MGNEKLKKSFWQNSFIPLQIGDEHLAPATDLFAWGK
jgi:hypothetical protein